jgi:hypothetical protein
MSWKQMKGYPTLASIPQAPGDLTLTAGYGQTPEPIPRIEPTSAFRTLGVHISPSGKQHEQIRILRIHAQSYHDAVQSSTLTPTEAYLSFSQYLRPKLNYPLPCTTLTPAQCKQIQAPALAALLPKLHMNQHSPHTVVFSSAAYGGLGLPDLYTDQCFGQLTLFIGHIKLKDENGQLILSLISHQQLFLGSSTSIFKLPFKTYQKWVDPNWVISIWWFTSSISLILDVENQWLPRLARENNAMLRMLRYSLISPLNK